MENLSKLSISKIEEIAKEFGIDVSHSPVGGDVFTMQIDAHEFKLPNRELDESDLLFLNEFGRKGFLYEAKMASEVEIVYKKPE